MIIAFGTNGKQIFNDMHIFNMDSFINIRLNLDYFKNRVEDGALLINLDNNDGRMLLCGGNNKNEHEFNLYEIDQNGNFTKRASYGLDGNKNMGITFYDNKL